MDCGVPIFEGEKAEEVYKYMLNQNLPSNKEKREQRLKEFSEKLKMYDSDIPFNEVEAVAPTFIRKRITKVKQRAISSIGRAAHS